MNADRRIIVVVGPHRCGTSVLTRGLETLGVSLGTDLIAAGPFNKKGYWEDSDFQALNKEMLAAVGREWHHLKPLESQEVDFLRQKFSKTAGRLLADKVRDSQPFGVKDPRFSLLLGFWKHAFHEAGVGASFVLALRNPMSATTSLAARDKLPREKGYWVWIVYMLEALRETEGFPRVVVEYGKILKDPAIEYHRIAVALGLDLDRERMEEYRNSFLDPSLDHSGALDEASCEGTDCPRLAAEMYQLLGRIARDQESLGGENYAQHVERWSDLSTEFHGLLVLVWKRDSDLPNLEALAEARKQEVNACKKEISTRLDDIAWLREKAEESVVEYENQLARLRADNAVLQGALESVETWQRSWFRRVFTRWHRFPKNR